MALTKVTGQVINTTTDVTVGVLTVTNTLAVGGTVSIGGTLTYEDVTNVDSVGLITARNGINVGSGITLSKDGDGYYTGVVTATSYAGDGSALTGIAATDNVRTGILDVAGVGTFRSDLKLSSQNPNIRFDDSDTNNNGEITLDNTQLRIEVDEDDAIGSSKIKFRVDGSDKITIDDSGRLLIGTTTEGQVDADDVTIATSGNTGITIRSGTTHNGAINFSDATSGIGEYVGQIDYDHNNNSLNFYADNTQCLRLLNDGSVTIQKNLTLPNGTVSLNQDSVGIGTTMTAGRNAGVSTAEGTILYNSEIQQVQCFTGSEWKNVGSLVEDTSTGHYATLTAAATDGLDHYWPGSSSKSLISNLTPNQRKGNPHFNNRGGVGVSTLTNSEYGASFPYFFFADQDDGDGAGNPTGYRYTSAEDWTGGDFSICFWICMMQEDTDGEGTAIQLGDHNGTASMFAMAHVASLMGKTITIGVDNPSDQIQYEHANWIHVGVSYDHSEPSATYYKNGVATETHTFSQALSVGTGNAYIYLGYGYWNSSSNNKEGCCLMSDIGVWDNKALTGTEIKSIYDNRRIVKGY